MDIWSWIWFCALNSLALLESPSFLPATFSRLPGLDLPSAQSRSTANNENWQKLVVGWYSCTFQAYAGQKRKQQKVCEIHEMVGLDLNIHHLTML